MPVGAVADVERPDRLDARQLVGHPRRLERLVVVGQVLRIEGDAALAGVARFGAHRPSCD